MTLDLTYAYLIGNVILSVIWLLLFLFRADLRKKMFYLSIFTLPLGLISEVFFTTDYWNPQLFNGLKIGLEDALFALFIGGISGVLYEELFGKKFSRRRTRGHPLLMFFLAMYGIAWMVVLNTILGINSIYASVSGFVLIAIVFLWNRHDLFRDALLSGILLTAFAFIMYVVFLFLFPTAILSWWQLENISGILVSGIPIEELMWAFSWGIVAGPAYEFTLGLTLQNKKKAR